MWLPLACLNPNLSSSNSRKAVTEMKMHPSHRGTAPPVRMAMAMAEPIVSWISAPEYEEHGFRTRGYC